MRWGVNVVLIAVYLTAFSAPLRWWIRTVSDRAFVTSLVLLLGTLGLIGWRIFVQRHAILKRLGDWPSHRWPPLVIALGALAMHQAVARWIDVDILSAPLLGLGVYGVIGLYASPITWRRAAPVVLLAVGTLPFGDQLNMYIGFVLRAVSADAASTLLSSLGIKNVASETILFLENGIAHVDIPCSGLRGLWTGSLFFLVASALNGHPRRRRLFVWVGYFAAFIALLLFINVLRITVITAVAVAADAALVAKVIHEPLGVIGFLAAASAAWWTLARGPKDTVSEPVHPVARRQPWPAALLTAASLVAVATYERRPPVLAAVPIQRLAPPASLDTTPIELSYAERDLFTRFGAEGATKFRTTIGGHDVAVLFVDSRSWRAQHPPELCLAASGFDVGVIEDRRVADDRRFRVAPLDGGQRTAVFWFQSGTRTTGHALDRIINGTLHQGARWVLVTAIVEGPTNGHELYDLISRALDRELATNQRTPS